MGASKVAVPDVINVRYGRHASGLFAGASDDLPGLMVVGRTMDDVQEDLLLMAAALVKERFGTEVTYAWGDDDVQPGFVPIDRMARERLAA